MTFDILLTLFLVFLNGFFVAAEFAIVKVRSSQIDTHSGISKTLVVTTKNILKRLDSYLAATQLGVTLASLGLGWIGEELVAGLLMKLLSAVNFDITGSMAHKIAIPIAFLLITVMHIVFGELAPKSIAIRYPASTSLFIAVPLKIFHFVFRPFIWLLNGIANVFLKLLGIRPAGEGEAYSEEELKLIITESHEGGAIGETEMDLIHNVFDFDNRKVKEIQTSRKNIASINKSCNIQEVTEFILQEGYSRYPVYEEHPDQIVGVVFTKDVLRMVHRNGTGSWHKLMRPPYYIPENKKIKDLLGEMQQKKLQMAFVSDEFGMTTGLLTMEDILEELVGEIQDEYDNESPIVERKDKYTYLVNAQQSIQDINKHLPYNLAISKNYDTLSGLILNHLHDFPREGLHFPFDAYEIEIVKTDGKAIEKVLLKFRRKGANVL